MDISDKIVTLTDTISYLPATEEPFSCDIGFVKTDDCTWIFDVGVGEAAAQAINAVQGKKKIVLSHFHPDHITNLPLVSYDELYVMRWATFRFWGMQKAPRKLKSASFARFLHRMTPILRKYTLARSGADTPQTSTAQ